MEMHIAQPEARPPAPRIWESEKQPTTADGCLRPSHLRTGETKDGPKCEPNEIFVAGVEIPATADLLTR